jgi:hypothetical protein
MAGSNLAGYSSWASVSLFAFDVISFLADKSSTVGFGCLLLT